MLKSAATDEGRDWRAGITEDVLEEQLKEVKRRGGGGDSSDEEEKGSAGSEQEPCAIRFFNLTPNQLTCQLLDGTGAPVEDDRDVFPAPYDDSWVSRLLLVLYYFCPQSQH